MFGCSGRHHNWQHFQAGDSITSALGASTGKSQALASKQPKGAQLMICTGQPLNAGLAQHRMRWICTGQDVHSTKCTECQEFQWFKKGWNELWKAKRWWRDAEHRGTVAGPRNPTVAVIWSEGRHASELFLHKLPVLPSSQGILPWYQPCQVQTDFWF